MASMAGFISTKFSSSWVKDNTKLQILEFTRKIPARTVKIISIIGMKEKIKPKAQAEADSQRLFFLKFEIVR